MALDSASDSPMPRNEVCRAISTVLLLAPCGEGFHQELVPVRVGRAQARGFEQHLLEIAGAQLRVPIVLVPLAAARGCGGLWCAGGFLQRHLVGPFFACQSTRC